MSEDAPRPEPIRFYGTSWVDRSRGYRLRRAVLTLGSTALTVAGALVLIVGYSGLTGVETPGWLGVLVVIAFAICTVLAFTRQWLRFTKPQLDSGVDDSAFRSINVVGFIGVLFAYSLRSTVEAPGERLLRAEYEAALERHRKLVGKRSGNPARRRRGRA
ncbi:hypothetical protein K4G22_16780 [Streptomyces profundus]|nr:hypothetical protein K4G22_16780 [Streptomyces sp. MA3_2.13]